MPTPTHANPTIDAVMTEVVDAMRSSSSMSVDPASFTSFLDEYQPKFGARLAIGSWHIDRNNVLLAAQQVGVIASAIATLRRQKTINPAVLLEATEIVKKHCNDTFREGVWCS